MVSISELITAFNSMDRSALSTETIREVGGWVTTMVNTFGLNGTATPDSKEMGWSGISIPEDAKRYVYQLSALRDELRRKARTTAGLTKEEVSSTLSKNNFTESAVTDGAKYKNIATQFSQAVRSAAQSQQASKEILQLCDRLRDVDLWDQGIYLEDRDGDQPALVRPVTKELLALRQEKEERELQKRKAKEDREREAVAKADKGRQSHLDMFRTSDYSAWDDEGLPTKDTAGEEVTKSKAKKLRKEWERQKKLHEAWQKTQP
jgi:cysteinyl-tRNA synthetase